ncbi:hypothetical protein DV737_g1108, partial [Chaetothyriales sp. CBS 132003]
MAYTPDSPQSTSSGVVSQNQTVKPINQPHKRSFGSAFGDAQAQSRPQTRPAVPSFNAGLESLLSSKTVPPPTAKQSHGGPKKANILGLTPSQDEGSESEDDGDEEARLAPGAFGRDIQFEYKGSVSTLRTPADIAAQEAQRQAREERERSRNEKSSKSAAVGAGERETAARAASTDQQAQVRLRAEKLRRKLEKAERALAAIDEATKAEGTCTSTAGESAVDVGSATLDSDPTSSSWSNEDDTSSSGSDSDSDNDSDSSPEELSSKLAPEDLAAQSAARPAAVVKRKGLWDALVEKEREDENRKVLQAIIALGDVGMLDGKEC